VVLHGWQEAAPFSGFPKGNHRIPPRGWAVESCAPSC
jgi:hypothetical protein